ncbi:MAG: bis(5'-nucleosyl)-tetraphosphatase (symmetrical) YqeK [Eubacteriales bacterium]|nr:bis(5'-nucleosyl)-tetraphosphatase (symmetrical) YqeK [Eubacteriales bacterium]MDY3332812.1 bis(5'-nucleosyl)-tetraphosphatase (symmetrical) YqeK [Gallibacter sp.]
MGYTYRGIDLIKYLEENLSEKRLAHTLGVADEAKKLARHYGANIEDCYIAGLLHDMCKEMSVNELVDAIIRYGLNTQYLDNLRVVHGKAAAAMIKYDWGFDNDEIINAVCNHTTGRVGMSLCEKIVYIADAIEPLRTYEGVEKLREMAYTDIDKACLWYMTETLQILKNRGEKVIDDDTLKAKDWFEEQIKNAEQNNDIDYIKQVAINVANKLDDKKADDIEVIAIGEKSAVADFMIIASASNERLLEAIADEAEEVFVKADIEKISIEGNGRSGWILLDYGDIIINLLTYEMRDRYNIERLWMDCSKIEREARNAERI